MVITLLVRYEMVSLSLHETNPGHHLQSSYSIEQSDWPLGLGEICLVALDFKIKTRSLGIGQEI